MIGGLCGGMARSLGVDATWVRVAWVVIAFATGGAAILLYFVLLLVVPEEPEGYVPSSSASRAGPGDEVTPGSVASTDPSVTTGGWTPPPSRPLARLGSEPGSRSALLVVGVILVATGAWLLLRRFILIDFDLGWPVIAIALGAILVAMSLRAGRSR